jgi:acyl-CoA hydrolase
MPRFLRQGDTIEIRAKVSNLTDTTMTVNVHLEIESGDLENIPRPYGHPSQEGRGMAAAFICLTTNHYSLTTIH